MTQAERETTEKIRSAMQEQGRQIKWLAAEMKLPYDAMYRRLRGLTRFTAEEKEAAYKVLNIQ